jgi:hypothetical protein
MPLTNEDRARGRARMQEIAAENKAIISGNVESTLALLGRPATALERMQAEALCSLLLRASRLRDQGRDDLEPLREAGALMREIHWLRGPQPAAPSA